MPEKSGNKGSGQVYRPTLGLLPLFLKGDRMGATKEVGNNKVVPLLLAKGALLKIIDDITYLKYFFKTTLTTIPRNRDKTFRKMYSVVKTNENRLLRIENTLFGKSQKNRRKTANIREA